MQIIGKVVGIISLALAAACYNTGDAANDEVITPAADAAAATGGSAGSTATGGAAGTGGAVGTGGAIPACIPGVQDGCTGPEKDMIYVQTCQSNGTYGKCETTGGPPVSTCVPGKVEICHCANNAEGVQTCQDNGKFDACQCASAGTGGAGGSSGTGGASGSGGTTTATGGSTGTGGTTTATGGASGSGGTTADAGCTRGTATWRVKYAPDATVKSVTKVHAWSTVLDCTGFPWADLTCTTVNNVLTCDLPAEPSSELHVSADIIQASTNGCGWSCYATAECEYKLRGTFTLIAPDGKETPLVTAYNKMTGSHCWACNATLGAEKLCVAGKLNCAP
jgi:hypothetical protein